MKYLQLIQLALGIAKIAEEAIPLSGAGKAKFDFGLAVGSQVLATEESLRTSWGDPAKFSAALGNALTFAVGALNVAGVFKTTAK